MRIRWTLDRNGRYVYRNDKFHIMASIDVDDSNLVCIKRCITDYDSLTSMRQFTTLREAKAWAVDRIIRVRDNRCLDPKHPCYLSDKGPLIRSVTYYGKR